MLLEIKPMSNTGPTWKKQMMHNMDCTNIHAYRIGYTLTTKYSARCKNGLLSIDCACERML